MFRGSVVEAPIEVEAPIAPTIVAPIAPALQRELLADLDERGQVTVRCRFNSEEPNLIRIWRSTYLVCSGGHRSALLHAEGIALAPRWSPVLPGMTLEFVLVFEPLPADCQVFDLMEIIPEAGGFHVPGIPRNERDLYDVEL
ncbi:MAG TPA: hypothetical protein VGE21_05850 [Flavobacteriales bacterium]